MNRLLARISFQHVNGADVTHFNHDSDVNQLGLPPHDYDKDLTFLSVGNEINLGGEQFKVVEINISIGNYFGGQFNPETDTNLFVTCKIDNIN